MFKQSVELDNNLENKRREMRAMRAEWLRCKESVELEEKQLSHDKALARLVVEYLVEAIEPILAKHFGQLG